MSMLTQNSPVSEPAVFFTGWDVGGWNCDRNQRSRDAIAILNGDMQIVGIPWRGNLRSLINAAQTTFDWIAGLFALCQVNQPCENCTVTLAIDTPLAFSQAFTNLTTYGKQISQPLEASQTNPYLYRLTEQLLFAQGLRPLSAVKDLIGSQATKGMHVTAKFAPHRVATGLWTDGASLTAFEAYPAACKSSAAIATMRAGYPELDHQDKEDALTCAFIAALFANRRELLWSPPDDAPPSEGWIWIPRDVIGRQHKP